MHTSVGYYCLLQSCVITGLQVRGDKRAIYARALYVFIGDTCFGEHTEIAFVLVARKEPLYNGNHADMIVVPIGKSDIAY